ncbi:MAG: hypothetical protein BRD21_05295 [Halobacteriales archaeon SW_8_66_22]|nr:MAG: hypothetical protein BRD21_05295 [Halobacteriales archaeon SW_8_66_22]
MKVDVQSLDTFNQLAHEGAEAATRSLTQMTGIEATVDVTRISLLDREDVGEELRGTAFAGVQFGFEGALAGETVLVFEEERVDDIVEALMPGGCADESMAQSGVEEIGNIITSGFVDGWANVLQQSVDHTPPRLVHDMGQAIIDPLAAQLGRHQRHAFIIDARMQTDEVGFESELHALPNEQELRAALDELVVDRADQLEADAEQIF